MIARLAAVFGKMITGRVGDLLRTGAHDYRVVSRWFCYGIFLRDFQRVERAVGVDLRGIVADSGLITFSYARREERSARYVICEFIIGNPLRLSIQFA